MTPAKGQSDELWEAMCIVLGYRPATRSERGRFNAALLELREIDATPRDLLLRAREYRSRWPNMEVTAQALVAHWGELAPRSVPYPIEAWEPEPQPELTEQERAENVARVKVLAESIVKDKEPRLGVVE